MNVALKERLIAVALMRSTVLYSELAEVAGLRADGPDFGYLIGEMLDAINWYEHQNDRPLLSAVAIAKERRMPGPGFFDNARTIGVYTGNDDTEFWIGELNHVHNYWGSQAPPQAGPLSRARRNRR
jgi:hypothetical protein